MNVVTVSVLVFLVLVGALGAVAYFTYQHKLRRAKAIERGLKMVPILIHLPPPSSDTEGGNRDIREVMREKTSQAEVLYNLIAGTATDGFKSNFYGQRHIALELIAINNVVHFFVAVPVALVSVVTKAVQTAYPGARMEEVEDHNIFNQEGRLAATMGGEMVLRAESAYPIATYAKLERDPMEALLTTMAGLEKQDGVAVQIMLRPASKNWDRRSVALANAKRKGHGQAGLGFSPVELAKAAYKSPTQRRDEMRHWSGQHGPDVSQLELGEVEAIEEKTKHPAFEVLIRVIVSTGSVPHSQQLLRDIATAFALFETPGMNGFKFLPALDVQGLVTAFIFRFFPPELKSNVLNSVELATLFHLPDSQFTPSKSVERQQSKQVDGPVQLPRTGLLFGHNEFRGVKKEIRLSPEDRRRHTYILGQTGTGKSTMLENLAVQDMLAGNGFAFIDPHGDSAEKLLSMVPKERAEDVIYFNPADTQYPLGLNLFEFTDPSQKDFLIQETINMLYKLYDPGHTGIIGPRYEHWYRNAALTLMSDPNGATFIEIPKVFTDTDYLKAKFKYLRDPTVIDFWTKEMGQTSDYHKSEMLGWFVSKFGAFQNNEMMRNIIGQVKSSFNLREVMDNKRILIVNLSKGRVGELNSQLLGMIFVIKFQAAAMSRADMPEDQRHDFALYVDEFQNFSTDSFASILSEARKYRLNLIVANQFIGQLSDEIREAVFGNIGTMVAHRMGPEDAEFMVKQFAPAFDVSDLVNVPNYNAVMRLMSGGLPSQPFTIRDLPPITGVNPELGLAIKQLSAAKYGHTKAVVEADILDRLSGQAAPAGAGGVAAPVQAAAPVGAGGAVGAGAATGGLGVSVPAAPVVGQAVGTGDASGPGVQPGADAVTAPGGAGVGGGTASASTAPFVPSGGGVPAPAPGPVVAADAGTVGGVPGGAMPGMATMPPPIGAPPVGVPPIGAPVGVPPSESPVAVGVPMGSAAMAQANAATMGVTAGAEGGLSAQQGSGGLGTMAGVGPAADQGGVDPASGPGVGAGSAMPGAFTGAVQGVGAAADAGTVGGVPGGAMPGMATMPPPIGAPPVGVPPIGAPPADLPVAVGMPMSPAPVAQASTAANSDPGTLSLRDITGGKLPRPVAETAPMLAVPPPIPAPAGALADDPYANIDILGVPVPASAAPFVPRGGAAPIPATPLGSGSPLPDDPYANIEILGDLTPPGAAPADVAAEPETRPFVAAAPPVTGKPLPDDPYANIDVVGGAGTQEPGMQAEGVGTPLATAPAGGAAGEAPYVASAAEPQPSFEQPGMSLAPEAGQAEPVMAQAAALPAPEVPAAGPAVAPVPAGAAPLGVAASSALPVPVVAAQEAAVAGPVVAPAQAEVPAEELIHFVDPNAQAVLERPEIPEVVSEGGKPSLAGLPEGVQLVEQAPALSRGAGLNPVAPAANPAGAGPVIVAPSVVPTAAAPLEKMAMTPPPIGAAPVNVGPMPAPPQPTPTLAPAVRQDPQEAQIAKAAAEAPIPALNATLVEALEAAPVPPAAPQSAPAAETGAIDKLESVAEMLEEHKVGVKPPEQAAEPVAAEAQSTPASKPEAVAAAPAAQGSVQAEAGRPESAGTLEQSKPATQQPAKPVGGEVPGPRIMPIKRPQVSPAVQIEKAEHEIDDLLSVSLIHPESTGIHRRLPEPVPAPREDETGIDLELNAQRPVEAPPGTPARMMAQHHGLKVIQPLEPIVPPKERFAKELAAMQQAAAQAGAAPGAAPQAGVASGAAQAAVQAGAQGSQAKAASAGRSDAKEVGGARAGAQASANPAAPVQAAVGSQAAAKPAEAEAQPAPEPKPWPTAPAALSETFEFEGLPQAESLAAVDVAKARHDHEAEAMQQAAPVQASAPTPAPATAASASSAAPAEAKPAEEREGGRRKRKRMAEGPAEHIESEAEAEHNKPTEAEAEASHLTGKLIMPTGEKPKAAPVQPKQEKPKKLAPGEVYVDEHGNVVIGE